MRKRLGEILVDKRQVTREQVKKALKVQCRSSKKKRKRIGEILVDQVVVTEEQVKEALEEQAKGWAVF